MTPVSRKVLDKSIEKLLNKTVATVLFDLRKSEVQNILDVVISQTELTMIKKRFGIIFFLEMGLTMDEVCDLTKTTPQTVSRVKHHWSYVDEKTKKLIFNRLKSVYNIEKLKELIAGIGDIDISRSSFRRKLSRI